MKFNQLGKIFNRIQLSNGLLGSLALLCVSFFLILSLMSYSAKDASWLVAVYPERDPVNLLGTAGANMASVSLFAFGQVSWLVALLLVFLALSTKAAQLWRAAARAAGFVVALAAGLLGFNLIGVDTGAVGLGLAAFIPAEFKALAAVLSLGLLAVSLWLLWPFNSRQLKRLSGVFDELKQEASLGQSMANYGSIGTPGAMLHMPKIYEPPVSSKSFEYLKEHSLSAEAGTDVNLNKLKDRELSTQAKINEPAQSQQPQEFSNSDSLNQESVNQEFVPPWSQTAPNLSGTAASAAHVAATHEYGSIDEVRFTHEHPESAHLNATSDVKLTAESLDLGVDSQNVNQQRPSAFEASSSTSPAQRSHDYQSPLHQRQDHHRQDQQSSDQVSSLEFTQAPSSSPEVGLSESGADLEDQLNDFINESSAQAKQPDLATSTAPRSRAFATAELRNELTELPEIDLLDPVSLSNPSALSKAQLDSLCQLLEEKLLEFGVKSTVVSALPGPVVTRFEVDLAAGVKASKVSNISRDVARSLSMPTVRVLEVIPGKPYIGIEVPNAQRQMVSFKELITSDPYQNFKGGLCMAIGKDISGRPTVTDLTKAPHLLVAGTTGSGKSVAVNVMLLSMLLKYTPEHLRLILIDPKQLELANYSDIPHLLTPVVTDMKDAASALNWCVKEMERRYKLMAFLKVRKLHDYNEKIKRAEASGEDFLDPTWRPNDDVSSTTAPRLKPLASIVVIADEFADMIMQVGKQAEELITRLAQKSRAAGIHLILATQRPSVDVITGLIKANIPTRMALRVNSKVDSRTILDQGGAEDMLGHGDMLFLGPGKIEPERVHGAFVSDDEVNRVCDAWRLRGAPDYVDEVLDAFDESSGFSGSDGGSSDADEFYDLAVAFVMETKKVSISSIQRKFSIGFNRAARIVDSMEEAGIVSSADRSGKREILM